jgi:hypothetical protein
VPTALIHPAIQGIECINPVSSLFSTPYRP